MCTDDGIDMSTSRVRRKINVGRCMAKYRIRLQIIIYPIIIIVSLPDGHFD
jgi:hypothetical protein